MRRQGPVGEGGAGLALVAFLAVLTAVSWRKWGNPELDAGADLTVAHLIVHEGFLPYEDVRYFYGPAGIYALAGAFKVLGSSFTVVFLFGYFQAVAILAAFYALSRQWLVPATAGLVTAVLMAIGFSGTLFNFVLPHTNSATFGLLAVLLELLAIGRGRWVLAGLAVGLAALTRPEFLIVAAAIGAGATVGEWRRSDARTAVGAGLALALPAMALSGIVLGGFALAVGADRLFFENLIPLDFTRTAGFRFQENWAPFTVESLVGLAARGLVVGGLVLAAIVSLARWREASDGAGRLRTLGPLVVVAAAIMAIDGLSRLLEAFPGTRGAVEDDAVRLLLPMSWLPAAAFAGGVLAVRALVRRDGPPLGGSWPRDLALLAGAAALALRAYNEFTTDIYATYYAALPLLVAAVLLERVAARRPAGRPAALAALAVAAVLLSAHAYVGLYRDNNTVVHTARGVYVASDRAAPSIQATIGFLRGRTRPGEQALVIPDDPGIHFMTGLGPALYEITFLPGTLDSVRDERAAMARLSRERTRFVVIGARRFDQYGLPEMGRDYNRVLLAFIRDRYRPAARFGAFEDPPRNSMPSEAFEIRELRERRVSRESAQ